jgi:hypothetical protein
MQEDDTTTTPSDVQTTPPPTPTRPNFDPQAVLALMNARAAAVKDASAKYEAASIVTQAALDFEIRL